MILGFAHITRNVRSGTLQVEPVPSAAEKWPLMERHAVSHRITLDGQEERIEYDTGVVDQPWPSRLSVGGPYLIMRLRSQRKERRFFRHGLGFRLGDSVGLTMRLDGRFPQWNVELWFDTEAEAPIDPPLDVDGCAALAFYSSDVEADRDHLLKHGGRTPTEPFTVKLDREMKIVMLRSPEGTIIELIQVMP